MAREIEATPDVTGKDAELIQREMLYGTPDTPERVATIRRAVSRYRSGKFRCLVQMRDGGRRICLMVKDMPDGSVRAYEVSETMFAEADSYEGLEAALREAWRCHHR